jgi:hypothetical protein
VLEKEGVPTVVVGTDEFLSLGKLEARSRGLPDLPFALTRHPLGGLKEPEVVEKAAGLVVETLRAVCSGPPK